MSRRGGWSTALVTGASSGIGRAFATELAARGSDLVLVARRRERLEEVASELRARHGCAVEVLVADLADLEQVAAVEARLTEGDPPVDLLINNAGFGTGGRFVDLPIDREEDLIRVNCLAPVRLTHAALPGMVARRHGAVVNISSVSGEQPLPGWATYAATKAFVTNFTRSLASEMKGSGVRVMVVLPGFTHTEFQDHGNFGQHFIPGPFWMQPEEVASHALRALDRGQRETIPGVYNWITAYASRLSPWPVTRQVLRVATRKFW